MLIKDIVKSRPNSLPVCGRFEGQEDGKEKNGEVEGKDDCHRNQLKLQNKFGTKPADCFQVGKRSH